jgi:hypothetical protein
VYDTLLFLHVLAAFALVATVVIFSAFALGAATDSRVLAVGNVLWAVGGLGTLVFGIWLAFNRPQYEIYDGWVIAALILWVLATGSGAQASRGVQPAGDDSALAIDRRTAFAHWMRIVWFTALLVVMVWKPGA